jgi:HD-GYP domain-containing protein (c-di-GMP phosphodiesterase class II)
MRTHAEVGEHLVRRIADVGIAAAAVRHHHERFDGGGYPDGLAGASIPFEARVVAVADAFHAMISERPYRRPIPPRQALQILEEGRGSQWDPEVVDAMVGMFRRRTSIVSHEETNLSSA